MKASDEEQAILEDILRTHGRRGSKSAVLSCGPSRHEREMRDLHDAWDTVPRKKVIYDTREAAEAAAAEMTRRLGFGPQWAYTCQRSSHGHQHLTSRPIKDASTLRKGS